MSHNINFNEEKNEYSFFSTKQKPWHGLGKVVEDYPTSAEAIKFAGLDFEVEKRSLFTSSQQYDKPAIPVADHFATVRTDTQDVLGVVGKDYQIVQNKDAFSFFDSIVGGGGVFFETAGAIGKGERSFITAKLPGYIKVGSDDLINRYLFLTTSHDGYGAITAAFTPTRIVCANTLHFALRNCSNKIKIRHTANAKERLQQAYKVMGISNKLSVQLEEIFNHWSKVRITDPEVKKLVQMAMAPNKEVLEDVKNGKADHFSSYFKNCCDNVLEYIHADPTQQTRETKGTVYGIYNGLSGYFQHVRNYKDDEAKLKSVMFGGTAQARIEKAFSLCEEVASQANYLLQ